MYLPQLTMGPSSLSWSPDGSTLVYSMQGSLWRQSVDSDAAVQLTAGPGYDFQPDWSPDGKRIAFVRYLTDALELYTLDIETGEVAALTQGGAVNTEPRWSPDGSRLAFVSTRGTGRFHVFVADLTDGEFGAAQLVEERESPIPRYYYSPYDHELSPVWTPDGTALIYVSNRDVPYGTGNIWKLSFEDRSKPILVRREETTWKARPDIAPDGKRIAYASYLGRQWHQLWVVSAGGVADPFPLTYGEFDVTGPRWSPDGSRIAYISNETGNTEIRIQDFVGGRTVALANPQREYLKPMFDFDLRIVDVYGRPIAARVAILAADGRAYAPDDIWMHGDDAYDRDLAGFETKYFHTTGAAQLKLPVGATNVSVWRGPEHEIERRLINISGERDNRLTVRVRPLNLPEDWANWVSGDVHVHMNYGGTYRNTPPILAAQARAEDLDVVFNLIVNKEQRVPDIAYFSQDPDAASDDEVLLLHSQEFHTGFWGHLGLLGLNSHLLLPDYSAYPGTAAASIYPDNATVARLAREQNATVGYVHPFLSPAPNPETDESLTNALPVDAALGLVDYYEVVGFADHRASAEVWYGLLNCGTRIAAAGGTDAMANYASLRGPVGLNRTYVHIPGIARKPAERRDAWLDGLRTGATMATNGPLIMLSVDDHYPGGEINAADKNQVVKYAGFLRSAVPVDHLELVYNSEVIRSFDLNAKQTSADVGGTITLEKSGWLLLRAWNETSHPLVFDIYPYATTSPVFVTVDGKRPQSRDDADYFLAWIERIRSSAKVHPDYNSDTELATVLANLDSAQTYFEECR